jgi:hypothetical protein
LGTGVTTFNHTVIAADADTYVFQITDAMVVL